MPSITPISDLRNYTDCFSIHNQIDNVRELDYNLLCWNKPIYSNLRGEEDGVLINNSNSREVGNLRKTNSDFFVLRGEFQEQ